MSKGKRPHDLEQNPFVLGVFFALRAIRIISAMKATDTYHIGPALIMEAEERVAEIREKLKAAQSR